jgi:capsular exopolysaccharide synthesis family protein
MSKIFEALQRAQQQSGVPATPAASLPQTVAEPPALSVAPPAVIPPSAIPGTAAEAPNFESNFGMSPEMDPGMNPPVIDAPKLWEEAPSVLRFSPRSKAVVAQHPTSLAAEQYRVLRTNIIKISQTQALKVALVTSPGPGDGKTTTAVNLALSFGQKPNSRVLLIEADLRKPAVGALVSVDPGPGLSDYLSGEASLEQVIRPTTFPNFSLLTAGKPVRMPADLLHSPRWDSLMEAARAHFDWVILDGPPTNPVADYELLTPFCDGVILVVRPFHTQRDLLHLTNEALQGRKVLGVVVNGSTHFERYGSAYGYGYGYGPDEAEGRPKKKKGKASTKASAKSS